MKVPRNHNCGTPAHRLNAAAVVVVPPLRVFGGIIFRERDNNSSSTLALYQAHATAATIVRGLSLPIGMLSWSSAKLKLITPESTARTRTTRDHCGNAFFAEPARLTADLPRWLRSWP